MNQKLRPGAGPNQEIFPTLREGIQITSAQRDFENVTAQWLSCSEWDCILWQPCPCPSIVNYMCEKQTTSVFYIIVLWSKRSLIWAWWRNWVLFKDPGLWAGQTASYFGKWLCSAYRKGMCRKERCKMWWPEYELWQWLVLSTKTFPTFTHVHWIRHSHTTGFSQWNISGQSKFILNYCSFRKLSVL